ncbi:MAG: aliphatic sulfonate ABC transporter substrate-binding protein [Candidatus Harrisonbacteria bacterium]|nr:aliphatic sulfonate ABC transporter substrate-binding protein [Candidatus Harrisonbacteria bacterium]
MNKILVLVIFFLLLGGGIFFYKRAVAPVDIEGEPLKIGLNVWIGEGIYYVAKEKGLFEKEGVDVELINFDDGAQAKQLINTNQIDAVYVTAESVVILHNAGTKVKAVAMLDTSNGADGVVAASEIKDLKGLKGKKVAYETGNASHFLLSYFLDKQGMSTKDVETVNSAAPDAGAAFVAGKVDAAATWEPWLSKASERKGGYILVSTKDAPIMGVMPVFREEVLKNRREDVKKFLRALFEAKKFIDEHPDEALPIIAENFSISVIDVEEQMKRFRWIPYEENIRDFEMGEFGPTRLIQMAGDLWFKNNLISTPIKSTDLTDGSFLRELYQ